MICAVIFDLDGVLIDSEPVNVKAAQQAFSEFGYTLSDEDVLLIPGRHSDDYIPEIVKNNSLPILPVQVVSSIHEHYRALWQKMVVLMPDTLEILSSLKEKGIILALATSASRPTVEMFLNKFGFAKYFTVIISADDICHRKPHPESYLVALAKLHQPSHSIIVVEDTAIGVTAAKAAGLLCAAIPNNFSRNQDFSQADYIYTSLNEVATLINGL
ncbi:MAG: HAD family phosphatase [bacterium]|nr:HAD family phosphatase [bacterium]